MGDRTRAFLLLAIPSSVLIATGALLGPIGLAVATLPVIALSAIAYFCCDQILLRKSQAQPIHHDEYPGLYAIAKEFTEKVGIRTPKLCLITVAYPIAFATGRSRNHAAIVISEGLIQSLSIRELRAVMAHQIAHIHQRNVWLATVSAISSTMLTKFVLRLNRLLFSHNSRVNQHYNPLALLNAVRATLYSCLELLAGPGSGRYTTDALAAEISKDPFALATALRKLAAATAEVPADYLAVATSLSIVDSRHVELACHAASLSPTEDRIERLIRMVIRSANSQSDQPSITSRSRSARPRSAPGI